MSAKQLSFLADESCDFSVIRALRQVGYSVNAIAEISPSLPDADVLESAVAEKRLLITEDKDFGEWVFAHQHAMTGVLLIQLSSKYALRNGFSRDRSDKRTCYRT